MAKTDKDVENSIKWGLIVAVAITLLGFAGTVLGWTSIIPPIAGQASSVVAGIGLLAIGYLRWSDKIIAKRRDTFMTAGIVLLVLTVAPSMLSGTITNQQDAEACPLSVTPKLTMAGEDALAPGTATGGTYQVSERGGTFATLTSGSTEIATMTPIEILITNNTAYHNGVYTGTTPCAGAMTVPFSLYKNSSMTVRVFNTNGVAMTSGGASTGNQSVATGGSYNLPVKLDGTDKTSTQDMILVAEASSTTVTDSILWNGVVGTRAAPSSYTLGGASAGVWVFEIPAVVGANTIDNTLTVKSKTGQTLAGATVKLTFLSKEHAKDSLTGKLIYAVEDSAGTSLSIQKTIFTTVYT